MDAPLTLVVDRRSEEPVYSQIARRIRDLVASGALAPGDVLPGVRTVASDLGVNLNTVARAYRALEEEGFVVIRSRSGVEVARPAAAPSPSDRESLRDDLRAVIARLRQSGIGRDEIERMTRKEIDALGDTRRRRGREAR